MEDDLDKLGVAPSDRKKLESMGMTRLEQIALLNPEKLGMGRGKGASIIRRARNIIAHENIEDIEFSIRQFVMNSSEAILSCHKAEKEFQINHRGRVPNLLKPQVIKPTGIGMSDIKKWFFDPGNFRKFNL